MVAGAAVLATMAAARAGSSGAAPVSAGEPVAAAALTAQHAGWRLKDSGSTARFRGLSAVSRTTAWVAGTAGTVLRSHDGGKHWSDISPPGAGALEFRDIEAFGARRAVVLAIGEGEASRVFRTDDAGATWTESFRNTDPRAFYDCLTFFDRRHGIALGDPVDGTYRILSTADGGRSWRVLPSKGMPPAQQGEAAFAASGQCLVSAGSRDAWIATGGAATARVLHTADRGRTWSVTDTPIPAGDPARGVFALAFRDRTHGLAVGGDYRPDQPSPHAAAVSDDAGSTWTPATAPPRPTAPAPPGCRIPGTSPWRSARPAATSHSTAAAPGTPSTTARTTPSTAPPTWAAGPRANGAGSPAWSRESGPGGGF